MGVFFIFPISILVAHLTVRIAAAGWRPSVMRSDVWTTVLITAVGDVFLEILLPSLQCLPSHTLHEEGLDNGESSSYWLWFQQTWGFSCPKVLSREHLLSPDSVGTLLTVRLIFMCIGVYLGESFMPVALTGGIACGKSTVAQMLLDPKRSIPQQSPGHRKKKKPRQASTSNEQSVTSSLLEPEEEGSFLIVDTDSIAHEILLPPSVLAGESDASNENDLYTVHPGESVYYDILEAFGDEEDDNKNILDENGLVDRRKLGEIIFHDPSQRRVLNRITHPRIILIMLKRLLHGIFLSSQDIVCADVPLLFESGQLRWLFSLSIVVACDAEKQFQRLRKRNPDLTEQQCRDRIQSQFSMDRKVQLADIVVWNNGDLEQLSEEVERVRRDVMGRIYGIGMSLLQMLLLVGGSLSLAVSSKLFSSWT